MPVIKGVGFFVERRGVQDEIVSRPRQDTVHPPQDFRKIGGQQLELALLALLKIRGMPLQQDPHLERKARGERGHAQELLVFSHDALRILLLLPDDVAIDASLFLLEVRAAAFDLVHDDGGDDGKAISCEWVCSSVAPAGAPWFLKTRIY